MTRVKRTHTGAAVPFLRVSISPLREIDTQREGEGERQREGESQRERERGRRRKRDTDRETDVTDLLAKKGELRKKCDEVTAGKNYQRTPVGGARTLKSQEAQRVTVLLARNM